MEGVEPTLDVVLRVALALVLLGAAAGKLRAGREWPERLEAFAVPAPARLPVAALVVGAEAALGALLLAGVAVRPAAAAACALGGGFALALAAARLRGVRTLACGCFGGREERSVAFLAARAVALAGLAALVAWPPRVGAPSLEALLGASVVVLALAVAALAALVLALYRQVGVLMLRVAPQGALELAEEGPPVGAPAPGLAGLRGRGPELVAFVSPGCRVCRQLAPAVAALARAGLAVRFVDESEDRDAFERWNVPGAPYVVHLVDGAVAAKGLVNTLEQLEGLVETGAARAARAA